MFDALRAVRRMLVKRREFRANASLSPEAFQHLKLAKFRNLAAHAAKHSLWYRDIVYERGIDLSSCVPEDFPVLTKSILMDNYDRIVTDKLVTRQGISDFLSRSSDPTELFLGTFRVIHTSGSSGEMGYFVFSPMDWVRSTAQSLRPRLPGAPGFDRKKRHRKGKIRVAYYAAVGGHFAGVTMISAMRQGFARFFVDIDLFEVNEPMAGTVERLNAFQPDVLAGYTGALMLLASQQQAGNLQISPQFIATAGEGMSDQEKAILESAFGGFASNGYGSSEHLMMGVNAPDRSSMLLFDDDLIYDIQPDCTLITNLFNFTLPLIRFRMADVLTPVQTKTFPDMPYLEIESMIGRTETMPVFVNEQGQKEIIHPITIAEIFVAGVQRFQLRWLSDTAFRFLVCLNPALDEEGKAIAIAATEKRVLELLKQKQLGNVNVDVQAVDYLEVNGKTRKFQLIVDDRLIS